LIKKLLNKINKNKSKTARFGQQDRMCVPKSNKEKSLVNAPSQNKTCVSISPEKNESIEYEAISSYAFKNGSVKRSLDVGNNYKAKKHCGDISISDLFRDQR
jgi:hypothetical protein